MQKKWTQQGQLALETLCLPFAASVVSVWHSVFAFVLASGFNFLFFRVSTKNSQVGFFNNLMMLLQWAVSH